MPSHVALLRGINVGGHNRVAMADLRDVVSSLGHNEVATYIQSGNVVFTSKPSSTADLAQQLEAAVAEALDVRPRVIVLTREQLARVVADNPYTDEPNPKFVHVVFASNAAGAKETDGVAAALRRAHEKGSRDEA